MEQGLRRKDAVLAGAAFAGALVIILTYRGAAGSDFLVHWHAARMLLEGRPPYADGFDYPPSVFLFTAPLGLLSFSAARLVNFVVAAGALAALAWLSVQFSRRRSVVACGTVLLLIVLDPGRTALMLGSFSAVMAGVTALVVLAIERDRWLLAGVAFAVVLTLKPFVAPLLLLFLWARRWRALAVAVGGPLLASLLVLPFVAHPEQLFTRGLPYVLHGSTGDQGNASLMHLLVTVGVPGSVGRPVTIVLAVVLLVTAWRLSRMGATPLLVASALLLSGLAASTLVWSHHLLVFAPLLVLMADRRQRVRVFLVFVLFGLDGHGVFPAAGTLILTAMLLQEAWWPLVASRTRARRSAEVGPQARALEHIAG